MTSNLEPLKKAGLKTTHPRVTILSILETSEARHVSAEDVYKIALKQDESFGIATIYRVLNQFESAGIVKRHHIDGEHSLFELDRGKHHDHVICVGCGRMDEFFDKTIEKHQKTVADKLGYEIKDHSLCIYGTCKACQGA